ncbi:unnamed protein product [Symbiodinium sp. CCMP2592]|nr:unnamed protein product [Symbiodinium sp. CCMP2592]
MGAKKKVARAKAVRAVCDVHALPCLCVICLAAAAAEAKKLDYDIQPEPLNLNDSLLAAVTQDLSDIMAHHLFSDILNREPLEIRADASASEAGYQVTCPSCVMSFTFACKCLERYNCLLLTLMLY